MLFSFIIFHCISCNQNLVIQPKDDNEVINGNYGITKSSKKLQIPINPSAEIRFLIIENPHVNKISFSLSSSSNFIEAGDYYPFHVRKINNRFFVFEIRPLPIKDTINLVFDKSGENLSFTIRLLNKSSFNAYEQKDNLAIGIVIGFYLLAVITSLLLLIQSKSVKILLFLLYIFFSLIWILNDAGILYQFLWPNSPTWHNSTRGFLSSLTIILFALYIRENRNQIFNKNLIRLVVVVICALLIKFFITFFVAQGIFPEQLKYSSSHLNAIILLMLFTTIVCFILFEIRKHRKDFFEMLAIITYCLFVISLVLKELGFPFLIIDNIHQLQALPFFFVQLIFMSIHLFKVEEDIKREQRLAFITFKINQEREIDKRILEVEENEKKRIAQNIHDEIGGIFVSIKYKALTLKEKFKGVLSDIELEKLIDLANLGVKKQYSIIDDLLFEINDQTRFIDYLNEYISLVIPANEIKVDLKFISNENNWTTLQKTQIFKVLTELITNTLKHAKASSVSIEIHDTDKICIRYSDDGIGFEENAVQLGNGLPNIKRRINALNGEIKYLRVNDLTVFDISIPIINE
ncbi:MAG: hypothetical protein RL037_2041 [Bacteroidota bacterium]